MARPGLTPRAERPLQQRLERAAALAGLGELSAAASALTSAPLAPGDEDTRRQLQDPARRPREPYGPLSIPDPPPGLGRFRLKRSLFLGNVRGARRGAAAGPSGASAEHLRIMLDDELCSGLLYGAARELAAASVPDDILEGMRLGRMVALRKPDGRVRGLVMSDVFRRIVARTIA